MPIPSLQLVSIPTKSYDGLYWGPWPNGDKPNPNLAGAASDTTSATGALTTGATLAGAATDTVTGAAALSTAIRLAGSASDVTSATGVLPGSTSDIVMYTGATGVLDQAKWPSGNDYSYGGTVALQNTSNVQSGHTYCIECTPSSGSGMGWQQATNWATIPPNGVDISSATWLQFDIKTPSPTVIQVLFHYTRSTGDDIQTSCIVHNVNTVPGVALTANTWGTAKVPLSAVGGLSSYNYYKYLIQQSSAGAFFLDNVKFVAGNIGWVYRGNSTPESGWADASVNATANYAFLPQTLNSGTSGLFSINNPPKPASVFTGSCSGTTLTVSSVTSGSITIGEILCWANNGQPADLSITGGSGTSWTLSATASSGSQLMGTAPPQSSIKAIALTTTAVGGTLKLINSGGYSIALYDYLTFAAIPTKSGYGYQVQLLNTSGAAIGSAVTAASYTPEDQGVQVANFTVYNIPTSAFGSLGTTTIGGISIKDTSSNSTNVIYFDQIGFFS